MRVEVKVPQLPESVAEATLLNWHRKVGEAVTRDENLVDVETDKVVLELPAPQSGVLVEVRQGDGATVAGQQVVAVIDSAASPVALATPAAAAALPPAAVMPVGPSPGAATALPAARKMMAERGLSPGSVEGTGRGGRVTKGDVISAGRVTERTPTAAPPAAPAAARPSPPPPAVPLPAPLAQRP